MSDLVFQDLISKDPSVLVLFDKFDFDDVKKSKAFTSSAARGILKDIYSRGFTNNSVCAMYVKNTAVFDFDGNLEVYRLPNEKAKSKGQIIVNEKDKADFKNRLIALLMRNDFKSLIILGREVANVLQEFGFYEAGSCLDTAKEINFSIINLAIDSDVEVKISPLIFIGDEIDLKRLALILVSLGLDMYY